MVEQDTILIRYYGESNGQDTYRVEYVNEYSESERGSRSFGPNPFVSVVSYLVRDMVDNYRVRKVYELEFYPDGTKEKLSKDQIGILEGIITLHNKIASARSILSS
jgi:hypothetical protein